MTHIKKGQSFTKAKQIVETSAGFIQDNDSGHQIKQQTVQS